MPEFQLVSEFQPAGDQPTAIAQLCDGLQAGNRFQALLGATGTGKTYTVASVVAQVQRPALILAPNKTLAAQLFAEFRDFFPHNAVEYFVSYYDYYQPEAYIPRSDTYIEKESTTNEEIERLRLAATRALFERRDVLIVASISCIYGLGSPENYEEGAVRLKVGETRRRDRILRLLNGILYDRNDLAFTRGKYRVRGEVLEVYLAESDTAVRVEFFGDEIDRITRVDPLTGEVIDTLSEVAIFPARHFVTPADKLEAAIAKIQDELAERLEVLTKQEKLIEAQRLRERTMFDIEMLRETGVCLGVENYSRHLSGRDAGETPWTLMDYLPDDFIFFIDESHVAVPQARGMYFGDRARKETLVEYGFRLPSALDNRPLTFDELERHMRQVVFVSATPGPFEREHSEQVVEQLIRPTGLLDPVVEVRPVDGQIDDLLGEVRQRVAAGQRCLVTTLTKRNAEQLAEYMAEMGVKVHYLHSEIETLERIEILRDLRIGVYDVVVGINLLREGLDLPEVSLVAILDADKEGYLRSETSLIQTIGRAARHAEGRVIMYADRMTGSMERAIGETNRRRAKQEAHNLAKGIVPTSIHKAIRDLSELRQVAEAPGSYDAGGGKQGRGGSTVRGEDAPIITSPEEIEAAVVNLEKEMKQAAMAMEFERAAELRDQMYALRAALASPDNPLGVARPHPSPVAATAGSRGGRGGGRYGRRGRR